MRNASAELSIIQLNPGSGDVAETTEIDGTVFSPTPESNTVKFAGTAATVVKASPWAIWAKVPAGAESGPVTVSTPTEGPATNSQEFVVGNQSAPSISGIFPSVGASGGKFTISGSNFDSAPADVVTLNNSRPQILSASGRRAFLVARVRGGAR